MTKIGTIGQLTGVLLMLAALSGSDATVALAVPDQAKAGPYLLLHDWHATSPGPTPAFLRQNKTFVETLPFDGVAVYGRNPDGSVNGTTDTMTNKTPGYTGLA